MLATETGLLVTAERCSSRRGDTVDPDLPSTNAPGDADRPLGTSPNGTGQSVLSIVGDVDRFGLGVVGDDRKNRTEDLFPGDRHVIAYVREHRRPDVVAALKAVWGVRSTGEQCRAFIDSLDDVAPDTVSLCGGDHWSEARGLTERIAHCEGLCGTASKFLHLAQAGARHDHACERTAGLTTIRICG